MQGTIGEDELLRIVAFQLGACARRMAELSAPLESAEARDDLLRVIGILADTEVAMRRLADAKRLPNRAGTRMVRRAYTRAA